MKAIIVCVFAFLALSSCNKYQFVTIDSDQRKSKMGQMIVENDFYVAKYSFGGSQAPVKIQFLNKTQSEIQIQWQPTLYIKKIWPSNHHEVITANKSPRTESSELSYANVNLAQQVMIIPPGGIVTTKPIPLRTSFFHLSTPEMHSTKVNGDRARRQYFSRQNTPMFFVSKVSVTSPNHTLSADFHEFWVSNVTVSMISPETLPEYKGRADTFHLRKGSGAGIFLSVVGLIVYFAASQAGN